MRKETKEMVKITFNLGKEQKMNAKKTIVVGVAVLSLVLGFSSVSAVAGTYWTDNFDTGETVGSQPSNWTVNMSGTGYDTVISDDRSVSGSNSILLTDDAASMTQAYRDFDPGTDTVGQLTVNTYFPDAEEDVWVAVRSGGTTVMEVLFYVNGTIRWRDGAATPTGDSYAVGEWKELKITWDTTAGTVGKYHVHYGGVEQTSGDGASFVNALTPNRVVLSNGYPGGTGFASYLDDVSVTPEPATMTLLLLGLPLALRRRR